MIALITPGQARQQMAQHMRAQRLGQGLTQQGLAARAGVSLASLRKFEQKGSISLESFLKLALALGCLEQVVQATAPTQQNFTSIDEVLEAPQPKTPQRGKIN